MNEKHIYLKFITISIILFLFGSNMISASTGSTKLEDYEKCSIDLKNAASWTFMAYWVADMVGSDPDHGFKDMDDEMLEHINMMELSGSTSDVNIVIQADDHDEWGGETKRFHIQYDENLEELADYTLNDNYWEIGEQNMGDPNTLNDFLSWAVTNYPAEHYVLLINGHGDGWIQVCQDYSSGIIPNVNYFNPKTYISIKPELVSVLSSCPHIDVLFFYNCHMGMIELFYELKDYADIILAGESFMALSPSTVKASLENLTSNPMITSVEVAQIIVDNYNPEKFYDFDMNWSCPLFGIQTKDLDNIVIAVDNFTTALMESYKSKPIRTKLMMLKAFKQSTIKTSAEKFHDPHAHELYEFAEEICNLSKNKMPTVYNAALEVLSEIDNSSIIKHSEKTFEDYHGLAIFSPPHTARNFRFYCTFTLFGQEVLGRNRYKSLNFAEDTQWDEILDIMYPLRRAILKIFNLD